MATKTYPGVLITRTANGVLMVLGQPAGTPPVLEKDSYGYTEDQKDAAGVQAVSMLAPGATVTDTSQQGQQGNDTVMAANQDTLAPGA